MKSSLRSYFASPAAAAVLLVISGFPEASPSQDQQSTAAEISKKETVGSALLRTASLQEYEVRSAAEAMAGKPVPLSPGGRKIQERKTCLRPFRNAHLRRAS